MKISHLPLRLATGAFILNSGVSKMSAVEEVAQDVHGFATAAYPELKRLGPEQFVRLLAAGEIAAAFDVTRPAVSQHLTVLKQAGLLTERRDGTRRLYRARPDGLAGLRRLLDEMWAGALDTARRLVEAERGVDQEERAAAG